MNHALCVGVMNAAGDHAEQAKRVFKRQVVVANVGVQGLATNVIHDAIMVAVSRPARVEDRDDVRVAELRDERDFAFETLDRSGGREGPVAKHLDRDSAFG